MSIKARSGNWINSRLSQERQVCELWREMTVVDDTKLHLIETHTLLRTEFWDNRVKKKKVYKKKRIKLKKKKKKRRTRTEAHARSYNAHAINSETTWKQKSRPGNKLTTTRVNEWKRNKRKCERNIW